MSLKEKEKKIWQELFHLPPEELRSQASVYTTAASSIEAEIQKSFKY